MGVSKEERLAKKLAELEKNEEKKKKLLSQIKFLQKPTKKERDARTHRLCVLAGTVEMIEGKEIPLDANGKMDSFEKYYRNLLDKANSSSCAVDERAQRWQKIGQLVEASAGREIADMSIFEGYIKSQARWIKG